MLHVFIINSHTTFLTAMGTVNYLHLKNDEVVFLYMRNYKNTITPVPFKIFDITLLFNKIQSKWNTPSFTNRQLISEADAFILLNIKEKYCLYVPHLWAVTFQIFYTHSLCKKISYIQEGAICQKKVFIVNRPFFAKLRLFFKLRFLKFRTFDGCWFIAGSIYKQKHLDSFAINNHYFENLPSRNHIIKWPVIKLDKYFNAKFFFFIFDGFVGNHIAENDIYINNCYRIINKYATTNNYIKFHPEQSQSERDLIIKAFQKKGVQWEILEDSIPMEYIILSTQKMTFIGFGSSLLHYAKDLNHNVICHDDWMMESSSLFREHHHKYGLSLFKEIYN